VGVYVLLAGIARAVQRDAVERRAARREGERSSVVMDAPAVSGVGGWHHLRASAFEKRRGPPMAARRSLNPV